MSRFNKVLVLLCSAWSLYLVELGRVNSSKYGSRGFPGGWHSAQHTVTVSFSTLFRYTAVAMPMLYNTRYSSRRRVTVMISVVWVMSFAISCPLLFGLNNTGKNVWNVHSFHTFSIFTSSKLLSEYSNSRGKVSKSEDFIKQNKKRGTFFVLKRDITKHQHINILLKIIHM